MKNRVIQIIKKRKKLFVLIAVCFLAAGFSIFLILLRNHKTAEKESDVPFQPPDYIILEDQKDLASASKGELRIKESLYPVYSSGKPAIAVKPGGNLQAKIDSAEEGAVLKLGPGEYKINAVINNKKMSILGSGEKTILKARDANFPVIDAKGSGLEIGGLQIADSRIGLNAEKSEIAAKGVRFSKLSATAFYAGESRVDFEGSFIYQCGSAFKAVASEGKISGSIIRQNKKSGVELRQSRFSIEKNEITRNGSYGVFLDSLSSAEIKNNYIEENKGYNLRLEGEYKIYK